MHWKRKITDSWGTGWKAKACTSFVLYFKVFKHHLHYLWHVRVLSSDLFNHVYIHSFRSRIKATEKFPGGGGIWSPGIDLCIWTAFRLREGEIWTKIFQKFKCPGGMFKLRFDWYITMESPWKTQTGLGLVVTYISTHGMTFVFSLFKSDYICFFYFVLLNNLENITTFYQI